MGLLDILGTSWEDPKTMAALQLAGGLLGGQGNTMQRLAGGLNAYGATLGAAKRAQQEEEERRAIMAQRALQLRELEGRMADAARAREEAAAAKQARGSFLDSIDANAGPAMPMSVPQAMRAGLGLQEIQALEARQKAESVEAFRRSIPNPQTQALGALGADASPTMANARRLPQVDPRTQLMYDAMRLGVMDPKDYLTATQKDTTPIKLGAGDSLVDPRTMKPLFTNPKAEDTPSAVREYNFAVQQGYKGTFQQFDAERRRAGASSVSVQTDSLGLKPKDRFDMEQKLATDFTAATKTDRGIVSVSSDLNNILKQPGSLKDQAAIYKFAKFLDPDGAVREADYAAIVKTAGGLDYVKNMFNKAMTGEQLGPKQRAEMDSLVRSMAGVAQTRIDGFKKRFGANARMYNLDPDNVFQVSGEDAAPLSLQDAAAAELARRQGRK